jgi:hypothetical protein
MFPSPVSASRFLFWGLMIFSQYDRVNRKNTRSSFLAWANNLTWRRPFAVSFTFKQGILSNNTYIPLYSLAASKNIQYFLAFLNRGALGKTSQRYGWRLTCVGSFERTEGTGLHAHFCIDRPSHLSDEEFQGLIVASWARTLFGNVQTDVKPCTDLPGWISYIAKYKTKSDYADAIDWMNVHAGCRV